MQHHCDNEGDEIPKLFQFVSQISPNISPTERNVHSPFCNSLVQIEKKRTRRMEKRFIFNLPHKTEF